MHLPAAFNLQCTHLGRRCCGRKAALASMLPWCQSTNNITGPAICCRRLTDNGGTVESFTYDAVGLTVSSRVSSISNKLSRRRRDEIETGFEGGTVFIAGRVL